MKTIILLTLIFISVYSTAQIPSYVPSNGLVGWWPFNGNANDESGNGNNGTVNGAILTTDRNGFANKAYSFDGVNDFISILRNYQSSFTTSIWFKSNGNSQYKPLIDAFDVNWEIQIMDSYLAYVSFDNTSNLQVFNSNTLITNDNWNNLICTYNSNILIFYLNGTFLDQFTVNTLPINMGNYFLGASLTGSDQYFEGQLDDIGIWNRALTEQEILALYQGCQMSITAQPTNQSVNLSVGNTSFYVASNATNPTYQWQTNLGLGFQNLSNAGQYSGVNTAILNVSNISTTNDNQVFRCIINDNGCTETSADATLNIIDDVSVLENGINSILVHPNPISNDFSISGIEKVVSLTLKDLNGKWIKSFDVQDKNYSISNVTSGVYFLEVRDEKQSYIVKVIKE